MPPSEGDSPHDGQWPASGPSEPDSADGMPKVPLRRAHIKRHPLTAFNVIHGLAHESPSGIGNSDLQMVVLADDFGIFVAQGRGGLPMFRAPAA